MNPRTINHLRKRLTIIAREETDDVLKMVNEFFPELKKVSVDFEDEPSEEMIKAGSAASSDNAYVESQAYTAMIDAALKE